MNVTPRRLALRKGGSLARQVLIWQVAVLLLVVAVALALASVEARSDARADAVDKVTATALAVADSPTVVSAVQGPDPAAVLQPYAEQVRRDTGTDFVVVMSIEGIRYTHPDPENIGKRFRGSISKARSGRVYVEEYTGTLGRSVRAVVPVREGDTVVALVSVGIEVGQIHGEVLRALGPILAAGLAVTLLGVLGSWLVNRRLQRLTHGMGTTEITRMFEYYDSVLRALREGVVLADVNGRVVLVNDEAERLISTDRELVGSAVADLGLGPQVAAAIASGEALTDEAVATDSFALVLSMAPARWDGERVGAVITLRDRTQLQAVTAELDTVRSLADSLRAQNHESANRLHTLVSLMELDRVDEAIAFGTSEVRAAQNLADRVVGGIGDPVVSALLLGKSAQAAERGVSLHVDESSQVIAMPLSAHDTVTVLGNLLDNAIDAAHGSERALIEVYIDADESHLDLVVEDSGPGIGPTDREAVFERGWSTKGGGRGIGLALVGQTVRRHGGRVGLRSGDLGGARFEVELGEDR